LSAQAKEEKTGGACSTHGELEMLASFWTKNLKETLERRRSRCEKNIKLDLREVVCEGVKRTHLTQDRDQWQDLVNMIKKLWIP
jgi:hypothetical protein